MVRPPNHRRLQREQFVVQVLITDRNCEANAVPDLADRQRCAEDAQVLIENFLVEVVQREPMLEVTDRRDQRV